MKKEIKLFLKVICLVAAFSMIWTVNASAEKTVLKVGSIYGYTGPYSTVQTLAAQGHIDYIRYINETGNVDLHPSLKGFDIKHISLDSAYTVPGYLKAYWKLVERGVKLFFSFNTGGCDAVKTYAAKEHMPVISGGISDKQMFPPGWIFGAGAVYSEPMAAAVDWAIKQLKEDRPLRIVWMTNDNPFGRAPIPKCTAYAKKKGVKVFGPVFIPQIPVDITAELNTVMSYKPDYVFMNIAEALPPTMANIQRMGLHKKNVKFLSYWPVSPVFKAAPEAVEACLLLSNPWGLSTEDTPGMKLARKLFKKYRPGKKQSNFYAVGVYNGRSSLAPIEKALEKVPFNKLNGDNILKYGLHRMKSYNMLGLGPNLTYSPDERRGVRDCRIIGVKNGKHVPLTEFIPMPDLKNF